MLLVSHVWRLRLPESGPLLDETQIRMVLPERGLDGEVIGERQIEMAYRDLNVGAKSALVLIHGTPMASSSMNALLPEFVGQYRLIIPDLPGFGASTRRVEAYSARAHAAYVWDLLDRLGVESAHFLGYSQGGAVALRCIERESSRVRSLTMLAAIGVQELELLGNYELNHGLYGLLYGALWSFQELVPHFGVVDQSLFNVSFARNSWDTDQRPLRSILASYGAPVLTLHGVDDQLVPFAAAVEHSRLASNGRLAVIDSGHMLPFKNAEWVASQMRPFLSEVESGVFVPVDDQGLQGIDAELLTFTGLSVWLYGLLFILGTQISEDLSCIAAGLLVARGVLPYFESVLACFVGIFVGDIFLYLSGRYFGRPAVKLAPFKWFLREEDVSQMEKWYAKRGGLIILTSRFVPGSRLPAYFAAGVVKVPLRKFVPYFAIAAAIWTPILVGLSAQLGDLFLGSFEVFERKGIVLFGGFIIGMWLFIRMMLPLMSWKGRRLILGKWIRMTRWEYWPMGLFYPPVVIYVLYLGLRFRDFRLFTAVNPAMPHSGLVGESKSEILQGLAGAKDAIARWILLRGQISAVERFNEMKSFMNKQQLGYPVVLKPDVGQRGQGVAIVRNDEAARQFFEECEEPVIVQEFVGGREFGVFYYRYPNGGKGQILGITDKRFLKVCGDGINTLETLILKDSRAVAMAPFFFKKHRAKLADVLAEEDVLTLAELGTHCRGAVFLDGDTLISDKLVQVIDSISRHYKGFYFGRYDIKVPDEQALRDGKDIRVLELNGVTSEATYIYDPKHSVVFGWKTLMSQWRIAFEIANHNRSKGAKVSRVNEIVAAYRAYKTSKPYEAR